jgi:hypothetical protein
MDPFGELDAKLEAELQKDAFKTKLAAFLKAYTAKDSAAVGQMRKDPQVEWIFQFTTYYDLKKREGSLRDHERAALADIELKYRNSIPKAYSKGLLKAMLTPVAPTAPAVSPEVARIQKYGIATREDAFALAKGKGRRRTGRARRGRGRRNRTKTRRL